MITGSRYRNLLSLSPIVVFLVIYVVISLIIGDFYKIPLSVALLAATIWALVVCRNKPWSQRIEVFAREAGNSNVLYMIWIFILAGAFANLADKTGGVEATVALTMNQLPSILIVPGLFLAACFISMAIGTSVGTVVALTPLAVNFANYADWNTPFMVAVVMGGAFFGDNLSFISDTTIAATRTQGCLMNEKFKANLRIVVPAAAVTFLIYLFRTYPEFESFSISRINPLLVLPYIAVIIMAVIGINVSTTLLTGIVLSLIIAISLGNDVFSLLGYMGEGIDNMGNLIIITLLAAGMLGLIKEAGGVDYLMHVLTRHISGSRGAQAAIALLVGIVNLCTANNTVAILTVGSLSNDIAHRFAVIPRRSASLLDTASCIVQCLIPYGAQALLAATLAGISPTSMWGYLYYPWILTAVLIVSITFSRRKPLAN